MNKLIFKNEQKDHKEDYFMENNQRQENNPVFLKKNQCGKFNEIFNILDGGHQMFIVNNFILKF